MSTHIEWTDETWNPTTGCDRVSPGCDSCYIERTIPFRTEGRRFDQHGKMGVRLHPDRLDKPLHWRKPRRVFVNSLSDLFHPDVPDAFIAQVFGVMAAAYEHTFQVLTKRPQRMAKLLNDPAFAVDVFEQAVDVRGADVVLPLGGPIVLDNVWLGTSVENQRYADLRIPYLLATPAAVRFLSCEPLLGPVDLDRWLRPFPDCGHVDAEDGTCSHPSTPTPECHTGVNCPFTKTWQGIDWVIVGGESGPGSRPMHPHWSRLLRDQCVGTGVPFFFKQWGEYRPALFTDERPRDSVSIKGLVTRIPPMGFMSSPPDSEVMVRVGKKAAGRELDGLTWDESPIAAQARP